MKRFSKQDLELALLEAERDRLKAQVKRLKATLREHKEKGKCALAPGEPTVRSIEL